MSTTKATSAAAPTTGSGAAWRDGSAAIAGIVATLTALGVSELLAGLLPGASSLLAAVAQVLVDNQPPGAKDVAVALFGTNDKLAFEILIVLIAGLIGAGLGLLARRRYEVAAAVFIGFGVVGFLATLGDPLATPAVAAVATAVAVGAGLLVLGWLLDISAPMVTTTATADPGRIAPLDPRDARKTLGRPSGACPTGRAVRSSSGRARSGSARSWPASSAGNLLERQRTPPVGDGPPIPPASVTVPSLTPDQDLSPTIAGLTPIVMPNDRFYRIDTAFLTPSVSTTGWTLRIFGMVDRETTLTWDAAHPAAHVRAVRDDRLRQQRGRRQARRQRQVDRRPPARRARHRGRPERRHAARRPLRRRLDGRHADRLGHGPGARADDRAEDERRAAAADPRLSRPGSSSPACTATSRRRSGSRSSS